MEMLIFAHTINKINDFSNLKICLLKMTLNLIVLVFVIFLNDAHHFVNLLKVLFDKLIYVFIRDIVIWILFKSFSKKHNIYEQRLITDFFLFMYLFFVYVLSKKN